MKPVAKRSIAKIAVVLAVVLIVGIIAIPFLVNVNDFRPQIQSTLSSALARPVRVGNLKLRIISGSVEADELSIADDPKFSTAPFIQAKTLQVGVEMMPLIFNKRLNIINISIDRPDITLARDRDGVWNFSSLGKPPQAAGPGERSPGVRSNLHVAKLDLTDGTISFASSTGKRAPILYNNVEISMRDFSFISAFPVVASTSLPGGGSLKIDGTAGPINSIDTTLTPVQAKVTLEKLDLSQSAIVDPDLGITGSADFDGTLSSDGHVAKAVGTLKATSLKLVPNGSPAAVLVQLVFAVEHDLKDESGQLTQCDIAIGKALANLTGTYNMKGETTSIQTTLNGQEMPVDDLEAMLTALGVVLPTGSHLKGGTLSTQIVSDGPLNRLVSTGWVKMENTVLAGFNLSSRVATLASLAGIQTGIDTNIQNLSSNVRHAPEGTRIDNLILVIPALGTVTGAGTVSPNNELDFKVVANLGGISGGLTRIAGLGSGGIPVNIGGTTSNPTFFPNMKGMIGHDLKGLVPTKGNPLGGLGTMFGKKKP